MSYLSHALISYSIINHVLFWYLTNFLSILTVYFYLLFFLFPLSLSNSLTLFFSTTAFFFIGPLFLICQPFSENFFLSSFACSLFHFPRFFLSIFPSLSPFSLTLSLYLSLDPVISTFSFTHFLALSFSISLYLFFLYLSISFPPLRPEITCLSAWFSFVRALTRSFSLASLSRLVLLLFLAASLFLCRF